MFEAIVSNLPIVLSMVVGIVLLVVEAFMPGFGVAGFFGVVLEIAAVVMTYMSHGADRIGGGRPGGFHEPALLCEGQAEGERHGAEKRRAF